MTRERLAWLLVVVGLVLGGWWLSLNTEWVDVERPRPAQGEARNNRVYAAEQLLRRLGMQAEHHESLTGLPPPGARLVLLSQDWELMPERGEQLHQWVRRGGHLVLTAHDDWQDTALANWVPIHAVYVKSTERPKASSASPASSAASMPSAPSALRGRAATAQVRSTLASTPPLWGGTEAVAACNAFFDPGWTLRAKPGHAAAWSLARVDGTPATQTLVARQTQALPAKLPHRAVQVLRVPVGQGSVTVFNAGHHFFHNEFVLPCDNSLVLAAAVQAEPGAAVWIYLNEKREALLPWLWDSGWIAIVIGLLALAAALWRGAVRFGPRLAPAPRLRRSISEQVRGLGAYLQGSGREALLAAQQRALAETAMRTLPRYARLPVNERVQAIATATGLAAVDIYAALAARFCTRAELPQRLQVLETARRRLQRTPEERLSPP
ncbi:MULTISPECIES: DUF4350 domain-containing protein [unclassified Roseateles]|uniref:DUF4350 domain-containing protein n=1 Tax=unclassified Roseateles TaxID=2626991 RepID=UPI0006F69897|nr:MULTISPECIES: DUF4350 domain-containing protein [unclassified Roseateles]KQW46287.1 hypothetical protein ASC81_07690 [Pelomonas sp. Root405]KRA73336.1 hypothetical protein ASD88_07690 [Pelomonas sp. Root662]